jgi:heat shock protein HslJ
VKRFAAIAALSLGVVLSAVLLAGCGGSKADDSKALQAHRWKAVTVVGAAPTNGQSITAAFENGSITGSTGINQYSGTYETQRGNAISIKTGPMTRAAGTDEAMKLEAAYIAALGQATTYKVDDSKLTLLSSSGAELVVYAVYVPASLTGTNWECTAYNNGKGGFQSVVSSVTITAKFEANGSLTGNGGVNDYNSTYTVSGRTISIQPPVATRMAGPQDVMDQEAAYLAALPKAHTYIIEGPRMTFRSAENALIAEYVAK